MTCVPGLTWPRRIISAPGQSARRRLAGFPAAEVVTGSFEDWPPDGAPADAVVAVNCLHWIDPQRRYSKPHEDYL